MYKVAANAGIIFHPHVGIHLMCKSDKEYKLQLLKIRAIFTQKKLHLKLSLYHKTISLAFKLQIQYLLCMYTFLNHYHIFLPPEKQFWRYGLMWLLTKRCVHFWGLAGKTNFKITHPVHLVSPLCAHCHFLQQINQQQQGCKPLWCHHLTTGCECFLALYQELDKWWQNLGTSNNLSTRHTHLLKDRTLGGDGRNRKKVQNKNQHLESTELSHHATDWWVSWTAKANNKMRNMTKKGESQCQKIQKE